jgi:hypothetical protein
MNNPPGVVLATLRLFGPRAWLLAMAMTAGALAAIAIPAEIAVDTPLFQRMTAVRPQDYAVWVASGGLAGLTAGTYAVASAPDRTGGRVAAGGVLSFVAVGCPVCNKVVVAAIGTSGALSWFAPLQLPIGVASLGVLAWALWLRCRSVLACAVPATPAPPSVPGFDTTA